MKMWAVIIPPKVILLDTAEHTKRDSIARFDYLRKFGYSFEDLKEKYGYRCKRITVTVEGES